MVRVRLDKQDFLRALLTDTSPGDVPIVYANDGLYINLKSRERKHSRTDNPVFEAIEAALLDYKKVRTLPYRYAIRKGPTSLRKLSLAHPSLQIEFCRFYRDYPETITYLCQKSPITLRAPRKVSNSMFRRKGESSGKYKDSDIRIDTLEEELGQRHASSYFAYRGLNRLWKFYEGGDFLEHEKTFPVFQTLDVANCFESVYTHSLAWAVKGKEFAKTFSGYSNQFADRFDRLIRNSNDGETNGVPVGSELSRIFVEILFQAIDLRVISRLRSLDPPIEVHRDYQLFRYVDDFLLFACDEQVADAVSAAVSEELLEFNLYINSNKVARHKRPFVTDKAYLVSRTKSALAKLDASITRAEDQGGFVANFPAVIRNESAIFRSFTDSIKTICHSGSGTYSDVAPLLIAAIGKRVARTIERHERDSNQLSATKEVRQHLQLFVRLLLYFFAVSPQVASSYRIARAIILADRFVSTHAPTYSNVFRTRIMDQIHENQLLPSSPVGSERAASLEQLNLLLATSDFGENFLASPSTLVAHLEPESDASYFKIVSLLYYARNYPQYEDLRSRIEKSIRSRIQADGTLRFHEAETAHLTLDVLSCPYVSQPTRAALLEALLKTAAGRNCSPQVNQATALKSLQDVFWFVKWTNLDLVKLLERRELNAAY